MKIRSVKNLILIPVVCSVVLTACGKGGNDTYRLYYTNVSGTALTVKEYKTSEKDTVALANELLAGLDKVETTDRSVVIKPVDVRVENVSFQEGEMIVYFSDNYVSMDPTTEAMYRTAVVKTLSQIEGVDFVCFRDSQDVITLDSGRKLSSLKSEDYVDDSNDIRDDTRWMNVGLYYTNEDGDALVRTDTNIAYNSNETVEKMIVSRLTEGPVEAGLYPVIPEDTKILGVSLRNGVCYVNFDGEFLTGNVNASGNLPVYSVVNSLCELDGVNEVRIMIDGSSDVDYRENLSLDTNFTFDNSYISD